MEAAFTYAEATPLETEEDYPYTAADGKCSFDASKGKVELKSFVSVTQNNTAQLQAAVAQGPVAVAIEADSIVFQLYFGGVIKSSWCGTNLDHGVLVVGYGTESGTDYWILKNSWGGSWGEKGYFRILRGGDGPGICGIQMDASLPTM
jgi:C1A family cysteine protease